MLKKLSLFLVIVVSFGFSIPLFAQNTSGTDPDMRTLKGAGRIIHSEVAGYSTDAGWDNLTKVMRELQIFDRQVERMMEVFCSDSPNKSVLIVGEANDTYKYFFARLSQMLPPDGCRRLSHVDFEISKLQGYMYVGTTERKWEELIETPAYEKDVIIYFDNLRRLIGVGTSVDRSVGIESTYASAMLAGKLRSISFLNKYDYNELIRSRHAYVIDAFQEVIQIEELDMAGVNELILRTLDILAPHLSLSPEMAKYLLQNVSYYQPNLGEPQRSVDIITSIINNYRSKVTSEGLDIATDKPYRPSTKLEWTLSFPRAENVRLAFEYFQLDYGDALTIYDGKTNVELERMTGKKGKSVSSQRFSTDSLKLVFTSDASYQNDGFKLTKAYITQAPLNHAITPDDIREAIFEKVQVPQWIIKKDYQVMRDFPRKLDEDVVGVAEGKAAVIRQMKIGYVSGRTDEKPAGALLFVGPTGTGKSYIAKKAAQFMGLKLITLDMTQYATEESFDRFLTTMANFLVLNPYAVYLFEEIDKADVKVLDRLYFMMDEGIFYDRNQRPLFARGAMIFMTTNAGQDVVLKEKDNPNLKKLVRLELEKNFRASFLNRFDATPIFRPFSDDEFMRLAQTMVSKKILNLKDAFDWSLAVDQETVSFIGRNGRSERYGARPMERLVESVISIGISEFQINEGTIEYGAQIRISKDNSRANGFTISVGSRASVSYEASLDINEGFLQNLSLPAGLMEMFAQERMYDDR